MLYNKQKRLIKHVVLGLVLLVSTLAVTTVAVNRPVHAAFTCVPNSAPCCQAPQFLPGQSPAPVSCFDSTGKKHYPVGDNPDKSPEPELGRCYTVKNAGSFGLVYFNADCAKTPFNVNAANSTKFIPAAIDCKAKTLNKSNCGIVGYLVTFINVLSALVGIVVVGSIIIAGIQFSAAGNDPQKVESARNRIVNSLLALLVFIFMFAFLQWVVPGGIF